MHSVEEVVHFLDARKLQVATAESCTAGLVTSLLADITGCGSVFEIGYVVYSEEAKHSCLGVSLKTMKDFGLTSEEVAREMAIGVLARSKADIAIAITGTAESNDELNGVVCFACAMMVNSQRELISETVSFDGDRNEVRLAAAKYVILQLPQYIEKLSPYR